MSILGLELRSHNLSRLKSFYADQLRLPVMTDETEELAFQIGNTQLAFTPPDDKQQPTYRFTISVPKNRFSVLVRALAEKVTLLTINDQTVIDVSWRRTQAVYLLDPGGNVVEFASQSADALDPPDADTPISGIIHVGLPVNDLNEVNRFLIMQFGLDREIRDPNGTALISGGAAEPFFLVQVGSALWYPTNEAAQVHPVMMTIAGSLNSVTKLLDYPYYVHVAKIKGLFNSHVVTVRQ